jgi:hypothetical protein
MRVDEKLRTDRNKSANYKMIYRAFGGYLERPGKWKMEMRIGEFGMRGDSGSWY